MEHHKIINKNDFTIYKSSFNNLTELYNYLNEDPEVNTRVFRFLESQESGDSDFYGESYEDSLRYLISGYKKDFDQYLLLKKELESKVPIIAEKREIIKSVSGSRPNIPNYIAGSPKSMYKLNRVTEYKDVNIYFNISCPWFITQEQILNRGVLTINLVKLLENNGYRVNLLPFELVKEENEYCYIKVGLKKTGELLNEKKCYFPLCSSAFLRRILFRVKESMDFENFSWAHSYGTHVGRNEMIDLLKISDKDIVINSPNEAGISGDNIISDSENFLKKIKIDKYVKVKK